jgi:Flp pilus assembly protein TadD
VTRGVALAVLGLCVAGCASSMDDAKKSPADNLTPEAIVRLATASEESGDYGSAANLYERAIQARPNDAGLRVSEARDLLFGGATAPAEATLRKAIELDPKRVDAHFFLGQVELGQHDAAAALTEFAAVLEREPGNLKALNNKGIALDFMGRSAEAQDTYRVALKVSPDDPTTRNNLGLSLALSGNYTEATAILEKLVQEPSATARMRQNLALALGLGGSRDEAERIDRADLDDASTDANMRYFSAVRQLLNEATPDKPAPGPGPGKS